MPASDTRVTAPIVKPSIPGFVVIRPAPGPVDRLKRLCVHLAQQLADREWLGTRQSRGVVICGFPRSGSTLLQLMLETAYPGSLHFGRERAGLLVAQTTWPGRYSLLITKRPNDLFFVDDIRRAYATRARKPCFIITTRDPRAILTSTHKGRPGYYVTVERWRAMFAHLRYVRQADDVVVSEYRALVERPSGVQRRLVEAIGEEPATSFDRFDQAVPESFNTLALNGVRPLDTSALDKWREPRHADRIRQLLAEMPELPAVLVEEGYERDDAWVREYR